MKPAIKEAVAKMTPEERLDFEERAAIMEYDGNFTRQLAEFLALGVCNARKDVRDNTGPER